MYAHKGVPGVRIPLSPPFIQPGTVEKWLCRGLKSLLPGRRPVETFEKWLRRLRTIFAGYAKVSGCDHGILQAVRIFPVHAEQPGGAFSEPFFRGDAKLSGNHLLIAGSCATEACEPRQVRKEAAVAMSDVCCGSTRLSCLISSRILPVYPFAGGMGINEGGSAFHIPPTGVKITGTSWTIKF